jgi:hypothetical protein
MNDNNLNRQDDKTARWLQMQFKDVEYKLPSPTSETNELSTKASRSPARWLALAASVVAVTAVTTTVVAPSSTPAWASEPTKWSSADEKQIREACEERLSGGLGELEVSSEVSVDGSSPTAPATKGAPATPPTKLPKTTVIDRRNTGALGVFEDDKWRVACLVKLEGSTWKDQGLIVEQIFTEPTPGLLGGGQTAWADGSGVSYLTGKIPEGKTCASFKLANGKQAGASCSASSFAIWYPNGEQIKPDSLEFY